MFYLVFCTGCNKFHVYEYKDAKRPRKLCAYCKHKFDIKPKNIIKKYDTPKECRKAHHILSTYQGDHSKKGDMKKILNKFRKQLREGFSTDRTNLENNNGHIPSPHDQVTNLYDLAKLDVEIDRMQITAHFPPALYHSLDQTDSLENYRIKVDFGTITVFTSGIVDFAVDLSKDIYLAQLEGILAYFISISGHKGVVHLSAHDREFTVTVPYRSIIADKIRNLFGDNFKSAFIHQQVKIYEKSGQGYRVEAQTIGDALVMFKQIMSENLSPGINVLAWNDPIGKEQLQVFEQKLDTVAESQDKQVLQQNVHNVVVSEGLSELIYAVQDVKKDNEFSREVLRERDYRITSTLEEAVKDKHSTSFDRKCDLIMQKLTEKALTYAELVNIFKQKQQGLVRYLKALEKDKKITFTSAESGKRGRPIIKWRII